MPYATNPDDGVRIYYEVEGEGAPLFLHIDVLGAIRRWWDAGYVDALREHYLLIMHDPRCHGKSEKPDDPRKCVVTKLADDVVTILDELGISQTHYFGYSLGARTGYWAAHRHPGRLLSLICGGGPISPPSGAFLPLMDALEVGPDAVIAALEKAQGRTLPEPMKEQLRESDTQAFVPGIQAKDLEESAEPFLPSIDIPALVYVGDRDTYVYSEAERAARLLPDSRLVILPGIDHTDGLYRSDLVLPHITAFLDDVEAGRG